MKSTPLLNLNGPSIFTEECKPDRAMFRQWQNGIDNLNQQETWELDTSQLQAFKPSTHQDLFKLIAGAPGTGKTRTIAANALVAACLSECSVLIVVRDRSGLETMQNLLTEMTPAGRKPLISHLNTSACRWSFRKATIVVATYLHVAELGSYKPGLVHFGRCSFHC